ncbi:MAG: hypothetical protein LBI99_03385 [Propionibacteriaceae bacterium]|nr:hypothetical protein [Propionibacteriaceae bacterium]
MVDQQPRRRLGTPLNAAERRISRRSRSRLAGTPGRIGQAGFAVQTVG